jgi:cobalt/nickel transport system ATP-binding protein
MRSKELAVDPVGLTIEEVRHRYTSLGHDTPGQVSFVLGPGSKGLLTGPNGSGKSTLLRRVVGLLAGPGRIVVDGREVTEGSMAQIRRRVGFLWQNPDDALLLPTVLEDVAFGPSNDGLPVDAARATAGLWLDRLGIPHLADRRVRDLSLGEKQLVSLAGVMARGPGLLLLDEPTSFLDAEARDRLGRILEELPTTMLLVSHEPGGWLSGEGGWRVVAALGRGEGTGGKASPHDETDPSRRTREAPG